MAVNAPLPLDPIQLRGHGPFETPAVEAVLGLVASQGEQSVHLSLRVQDGKELRIPLTGKQLEEIRALLNKVLT